MITPRRISNLLKMNPEVPKILIGPPGIGKTQIVNQFAQENNRKLYTIVLSHLDIDDIKGVPYINLDGKLEVKKGPLIPAENEEAIVFLDEITTAGQAKLAIAMKIIDEKMVGYFRFPSAWIVAAGNPTDWNGLVLDTRITSRAIVVNVEPSVEDFVEFVVTKYKASPITETIIAFLNFDKSMVLKKPTDAGQPFPTPRAYELLIKTLYGVSREEIMSDSVEVRNCIEGALGTAAGIQLIQFLKLYKNLPVIEQVLAGQEVKYHVPKELNICYIVTTALAYRVENERQARHAYKFLAEYILPKGRDFVILATRIMLKRKIQLDKNIVNDLAPLGKIDVFSLLD